MMTSKGEAEAALARIAQLSRAVSIHTIIATQRPSVNVITGVIKANYPTRIAPGLLSDRFPHHPRSREPRASSGPATSYLILPASPFSASRAHSFKIGRSAPSSSTWPASVAEHRVNLSGLDAIAGDQAGTQMNIDGIEGDDDEALFKKALITVAETQNPAPASSSADSGSATTVPHLIEELEDRMHIGPQTAPPT